MAELVKRMELWVRRQLYIKREEGKCVRLALRHITASGKIGTEVFSYNVPDETSDTTWEQFCQDCEAASEADASGLGGLQSYVVLPYFEGSEKPIGRFAFKIAAADESGDEEGYTSEPANRTGLVAQSMRHTEAIMKSSVMMQGQIYGNMQRMLDSLAETVEKLTNEKFQTLRLIEELSTEKHKRDVDLMRETNNLEMKQQAFEKLQLLLPAAVNKLAGKKLLPESVSPLQMGLKSFFDGLTPEQLEAITTHLKPEQVIALTTLVQSMDPTPKKEAENVTALKRRENT